MNRNRAINILIFKFVPTSFDDVWPGHTAEVRL